VVLLGIFFASFLARFWVKFIIELRKSLLLFVSKGEELGECIKDETG
jgi:hypothetical protein